MLRRQKLDKVRWISTKTTLVGNIRTTCFGGSSSASVRPHKVGNFGLGGYFGTFSETFFFLVICARRADMAANQKKKNRNGTYFKSECVPGVFATRLCGSGIVPKRYAAFFVSSK
jgi:hypothetical protein